MAQGWAFLMSHTLTMVRTAHHKVGDAVRGVLSWSYFALQRVLMLISAGNFSIITYITLSNRGMHANTLPKY